MRVILAILFLSFASHAKAEDQLWIIIWGQHSSENHAKIGVGIAHHLDKSNFKSRNECEQYLISHFCLSMISTNGLQRRYRQITAYEFV